MNNHRTILHILKTKRIIKKAAKNQAKSKIKDYKMKFSEHLC